MPADYVQRLLAGWRHDTGILCSPPVACRPDGFWAELECAFLNTYQARWQYSADSLGQGFAQGKTMLMRRRDLASAGGIHALAEEIAEDAAATKLMRSLGLRATLVDAPFGQPLGERTARQVWARQTRWARLRRMSFPGCFAAEVLTGCLPSLAAAAFAADALDVPAVALVVALAAIWLGSEALLARTAGWHLSLCSPFAWLLRDTLLPLVWLHASAERRLRLARQRDQHGRKQRARELAPGEQIEALLPKGFSYADRAYEKKERRARLKAAGIKDRIMHRRHKHMARLPYWQEKRNWLIARRRAPVEAVFSAAKRLYGLTRARYASLIRNAVRTMAVFTVYNLRRASLLAGP
jgi:Glycosyl transferase family 21/Transposase DDE domain